MIRSASDNQRSTRPPAAALHGRNHFVKNDVAILKTTVVNAAAAIQRLTGLIYEQRSRLDSILSATSDGILLYDRQGECIIENQLGRKYLAELCDCNLREEKCIIHRMLADTLIGSQGTRSGTITRTGNTYTVQSTYLNENREHALVSFRIFCAPAKASQGASGDTKETVLLIKRLAAALAHEINNPLTPILGLSCPEMQAFSNTAETSKYLPTIYEAGGRIAAIIRELTKIETLLQGCRSGVFSSKELTRELRVMLSVEKENHCLPEVTVTCRLCRQDYRGDLDQVTRIVFLLLKSLVSARRPRTAPLHIIIDENSGEHFLTVTESLPGSKCPQLNGIEAAGIPEHDFQDYYLILANVLCQNQHLQLHSVVLACDKNGYRISLIAEPPEEARLTGHTQPSAAQTVLT